MMTIEQIQSLDRTSDPTKLLPTTIAFMKAMRDEANTGRARKDEPVIPWRAFDEDRY